MRTDKVKDLRDSLNAILTLDPDATFQFEDCGSGTTTLNIIFSKKALKKITLKNLDNLQEFDIVGDDGATVKERLVGDEKNSLFICLS